LLACATVVSVTVAVPCVSSGSVEEVCMFCLAGLLLLSVVLLALPKKWLRQSFGPRFITRTGSYEGVNTIRK